MCIKAPTPPRPQTPPDPNKEQSASVQRQRKATQEQQGVFANIFTSALGDTNYGKSVA